MTSPNYQECPECSAEMPINAGYVTWCDQCGWNLLPHRSEHPSLLFGAIYSRLGEKNSRKLFETLKDAHPEVLSPRPTVSRFITLVLAAAVHGITLGLVALGVLLAFSHWPNPVMIFLGMFCLLVAWVLRPRAATPPRKTLPRDRFSALYRLVDSISDICGGGPVASISVTGDFNAALSRVGWSHKKVLHLGLPLWIALDTQERIALLGHELAHDVNGDLTRTLFVGSAIHSLGVWHTLICPDHIWESDEGLIGVAMIPVNLVRLGFSELIWLIFFAATHLIWVDSQRAEYLADYLATTISGTDAMLSTLRKLHLGPIFYNTVDQTIRRQALREKGDSARSLFERFQSDLEAIPDRELERIDRLQSLVASRLDSTHPPTAYRVAFLKAHHIPEARIRLSASEADEVDRDLSAIQETIEREVLDAHRAHLQYDT